MRQLEMPLKQWGGKRKRSGRKPAGLRSCVRRIKRPKVHDQLPVDVTLRVLADIPTLRAMAAPITRALHAGAERERFRLLHYSIQDNHLHLIAEADDARSFSRGMQGLAIRIAWAVNRALSRKRGKVFSDRYHQRLLKTPTQARHALVYVNQQLQEAQARAACSLRRSQSFERTVLRALRDHGAFVLVDARRMEASGRHRACDGGASLGWSGA